MQVCEEYESVYILSYKVGDGLKHESFDSGEQCIASEEDYESKGISASCSRIISNTGCN